MSKKNLLFGGMDKGHVLSSLPVSKIKPDPDQPRKHFDAKAIEELAATIKEKGLIQPIIVRSNPDQEEGGYIIIAGERRWRAVQKLGLESIDAVLRDDLDARTSALIENIQRVDLKPVEEANAVAELIDQKGIPQGDVASLIGKSRTTVNQILTLRKLPEDIQAESVKLGTPKSILVELAKLKDENTVARLWSKSKAEALTIPEIRKAAKPSGKSKDGAGETVSATERAIDRAFSSLAVLETKELSDEERGRLVELQGTIDKLLHPEPQG